MKRLKEGMIVIGMAFLVAACAGMDQNSSASDMDAPSEGGAYAEEASAYGYESNATNGDQVANGNSQTDQTPEDLSLERKLIKDAYVSFETDSLEKRKRIVKEAVKMYDAYVEHEEQFMEYDRELVETKIRVPNSHFDDFMDKVTGGVGSFDSKTITVDDVTEEFVDVAARIETKKELKVRFLKLLDKAETIAKIMEVEREITALQAEIESYEGRLKYLAGSVKYSTITLSYYRMLEIPTKFDNKFEVAFKGGWNGVVWFFVGLASIWPLVIIGIGIFIYVRLRIKSSKNKL